jgi:hypothetical protein
MEAHHQLMIERMQKIEEALLRAEKKEANEDDWQTIYFECGLKRKNYELDRIRT